MTVYDELAALVEKHLQAYHADLRVHDRKAIEEHQCPFLHWTRSTGTDLVLLLPANAYPQKGVYVPYLFGTADRYHILKSATVIADYEANSRENRIAHYYDGKCIVQVSLEKAREIARQYVRSVEREWEAPKQLEYA